MILAQYPVFMFFWKGLYSGKKGDFQLKAKLDNNMIRKLVNKIN